MLNQLLVVAILLVISFQQCFNDLNIGASEQLVQIYIEQNLNLTSIEENYFKECLSTLIQRGFYRQALELYETTYAIKQFDVSDNITSLLAFHKKKLDGFITNLMIQNQQIQQIKPSIIWAQSKDSIFLQLKLAIRRDSPACLHCKLEKIEIKENKIFFSSYGIISNQPCRYQLDLELEQNITIENSTWQEESVGTTFFNLSKQVKDRLWFNLEKNNDNIYSIWWDMREKYKTDMDQWLEFMERKKQDKIDLVKENKKKEKDDKKKYKIQQEQTKILTQVGDGEELQKSEQIQKNQNIIEKQQNKDANVITDKINQNSENNQNQEIIQGNEQIINDENRPQQQEGVQQTDQNNDKSKEDL